METGQWHFVWNWVSTFQEGETTLNPNTLFLPSLTSFLLVGPGRNCLPSWFLVLVGVGVGGGWEEISSLLSRFISSGESPCFICCSGSSGEKFSFFSLMTAWRWKEGEAVPHLPFCGLWLRQREGVKIQSHLLSYFGLPLTFLQTTLLAKRSRNQLICVTFCGFYEWTFLKDLCLRKRVIFPLEA